MNTILDWRVRRFAVVGVANTIFGLALIYACKAVFDLGDVASNFIGYATAVLCGFAWNKRWTFGHRGDTAAAFGRYLAVLGAAYIANLCVTLFTIEIMHLGSYFGHAAGVFPYAVVGYVGSRLFAFPVRKY